MSPGRTVVSMIECRRDGRVFWSPNEAGSALTDLESYVDSAWSEYRGMLCKGVILTRANKCQLDYTHMD